MTLNFERLIDIEDQKQKIEEGRIRIYQKFTGDETRYYEALSIFFIKDTEALFDYVCKKAGVREKKTCGRDKSYL
jgi:hypothetical protein